MKADITRVKYHCSIVSKELTIHLEFYTTEK
jgi:hypothetical protein